MTGVEPARLSAIVSKTIMCYHFITSPLRAFVWDAPLVKNYTLLTTRPLYLCSYIMVYEVLLPYFTDYSILVMQSILAVTLSRTILSALSGTRTHKSFDHSFLDCCVNQFHHESILFIGKYIVKYYLFVNLTINFAWVRGIEPELQSISSLGREASCQLDDTHICRRWWNRTTACWM